MSDDEFDYLEADSLCSLSDSGSKCTIFVVDRDQKMFESYADTNGDGGGDDCAFRRALKIIRLQMINRAVTSSRCEYTSVIFMNCEKRSHQIDNLVVYQDVDQLNIDRVKQINELYRAENLSASIYGICGGTGKADYSEVLFHCLKMLSSNRPKFQKKVVYLFTNESDPFGANKQHLISVVKTVDDFRKSGADFGIFPLLSEAQEFDFDFSILQRIDPNVEKNCENLTELEDDIPRKQYGRRNICGINLSLGDGVQFAVGVYSVIRSEKLPKPAMLDAETNECTQRYHVYRNKETQEEAPLLDGEITRRREIGGVEVSLTAEELESLRRLTPPGLVLLGFKPISCLKISHHVRSCQYIYPLEELAIGSTCLYRALYELCLAQNKMMICRYTQKENVPPKVVALVPQRAPSEDANYSKVTEKFYYPGFHLIYLPFAEDKRDLSEHFEHPDGEWPKANQEQIQCARNFVRKLTSSYFPEKFANPVLQRHFKVVEAFALDYDDLPDVDDQIQPYFVNEIFRKRVEKELSEFKSCVLSPDYCVKWKPKTSKSTKRVKPSDNKA